MADLTEIVLVLTSVATRADADRLARAMVERRLAACVHVEAIDSVYHWQGSLRQEPEFRLLLKTGAARHAALIEALRQAHPYELPALVTLRAHDVTADYARWIEQQTR